jgi:hypothetical protein
MQLKVACTTQDAGRKLNNDEYPLRGKRFTGLGSDDL